MASLKKKRRTQIVLLAAGLLASGTALMVYASRDAFQYFRAPSDLATDPPRPGERFRLGGMVKEGTWERGGESHAFIVTDFEADYPVRYTGIVPDLFDEGQGTVVTGTIEDGVFVATEVLARHDESYMPREVVDALKDSGVFREGAE